MGMRLGPSEPEVYQIEPTPLLIKKRLANVGLLEQLYYSNDGTYVPNRRLSPLTLIPEIECYDPDSGQTFVPTLSSAPKWTVYTPTADGGTVINSTYEQDDYYKSGNNLIVRKNVDPSVPIRIKCEATFVDQRTIAITNTVEMEQLLSTIMETDQVYPHLNIKNANRVSFNPLSNVRAMTFIGEAYKGENPMVLSPDTGAEATLQWFAKRESEQDYSLIDAVDSYGCPKFLCYALATQPSGKGQGTDTIVINPMYADKITICLRAKKAGTNAFYPGETYSNVVWEWPTLSKKSVSACGHRVKRQDQMLEVENIVTATKMGTLSDAVVKENFLAVWFSRDVTQPDYDGNGNPLGKICRGIAPKLKISASVLWNASRQNRNVFAELIALGHRRPVSCNGHPVTCNGHIVTCRDSVLPQQNNNQNS